MELTTERLCLRPLLAEDALVYAALWSDARVHPFIVEDGPVPPSAVPGRVARQMRAWVEGSGATWSVVHADDVVGFVSLQALGAEALGPVASLRLAIVPRCWRRGFAREALAAVLGSVEALGVERIEARVHPAAPGCPSLLVGLGFVEEAVSGAVRGGAPRTFAWGA